MDEETKRIRLFAIIPVFAILCAIFIYYLPNNVVTKKNLEKNPSNDILLVALQKSGSTYLMVSLQENLNYTHMPLHDYGVSPGDLKLPSAKYVSNNMPVKPSLPPATLQDFFKKKSLIAKEHYPAPNVIRTSHRVGVEALDVKEVKKYTDKIVVHVRDPRQTFLSYIHHINLHRQTKEGTRAWPEGHYDLGLSAQIDWSIENLLPSMVLWISDWLDFKEAEERSNHGLKILMTTYDELIQDEVALINKIATFYEIPFNPSHFKKIAKDGGVRFRKGNPEEWRSVLTEAQKKRVAEIVPNDLLEKFNWKP